MNRIALILIFLTLLLPSCKSEEGEVKKLLEEESAFHLTFDEGGERFSGIWEAKDGKERFSPDGAEGLVFERRGEEFFTLFDGVEFALSKELLKLAPLFDVMRSIKEGEASVKITKDDFLKISFDEGTITIK